MSGRALVVGGLGVAVLAGHAPFWLIAIVAFCEGSLFVVFTLCEEAALPNVVPAEQLLRGHRQNEARARGAALAGQPLGGGSSSASARPSRFWRTDSRTWRRSSRSDVHPHGIPGGTRAGPARVPQGDRRKASAWLWGQPFLRAAALLVAGSNFVFQALVLIAIVLAQDHGASPALVGVISACSERAGCSAPSQRPGSRAVACRPASS